MKEYIISKLKNEFIFGKKNFILSMWKLTVGYGIGIGFYLDKIRGKI